MLANLIVRDPALDRLIDEDYSIRIEGSHLIIENVPYVSAAGVISRAELISAFRDVNGVCYLDNDHTVWFTGTVPCGPDGRSLQSVLVVDTEHKTIAGLGVKCRLSNKPDPIGEMLDNIYNKMMHYIDRLTGFANAIDPSVSARSSGASFRRSALPSPFYFSNDTVVRAGLEDCEAKLKLSKVAIVGVGGTGSYILDTVVKAPIDSIHFYDDDIIEPKNVFRMPGALSPDAAEGKVKKVIHLEQVYSAMRSGIRGHDARISNSNVNELNDCDFVFIAVDDGPSRGLIANHLVQRGIPFIDVGIGVNRVPDHAELVARARVTLVTPDTAHLIGELPTQPDTEDAIYNNIQVVEINALNACLAVVRFKQFFGFYAEDFSADTIKYILAWNHLVTEPRMAS